jgi:hypothetical protein
MRHRRVHQHDICAVVRQPDSAFTKADKLEGSPCPRAPATSAPKHRHHRTHVSDAGYGSR